MPIADDPTILPETLAAATTALAVKGILAVLVQATQPDGTPTTIILQSHLPSSATEGSR